MLLLPVYSSEPGSHPQAPTLQALLWKRSEKVACGRSERELSVENYANKSERKLSLEKKKINLEKNVNLHVLFGGCYCCYVSWKARSIDEGQV